MPTTDMESDHFPEMLRCSDEAEDKTRKYCIEPLSLNTTYPVFNINLHDDTLRRERLEQYYSLCRDHKSLQVTTSCFTIWRKNKKTNGYAKVIPALPMGATGDISDAARVFFFDDNLEWGGGEHSPGICNLRDVATGKFVEFAAGQNGFQCDHAGRHTVIHYSTEYRNVLVKANILDAIADKEYFVKIIDRFSKPDEKIMVFMDVNSTIVCNDSVQSKDLASVLYSTMFEFIEFRPNTPFDWEWHGYPPLRVETCRTLKSLMKETMATNQDAYAAFWTRDACDACLNELLQWGQVAWQGSENPISSMSFHQMFEDYFVALQSDISKDGIASSWFQVFEGLKGEHTVVLNSFGVDTRKVILATVPDEHHVIQVAVNYELWDARDVKKFESQFA